MDKRSLQRKEISCGHRRLWLASLQANRAHSPLALTFWILASAARILGCSAGGAKSDPFAAAREEMVRSQIEARGVKDKKVLAAMRKVKRHLFVPAQLRPQAYGDYPLPIGHGQTISQPFIVAWMTELLELKGGEKVLEIGTGSGYQAAVLGEIAGKVCSVEIIPALAEAAHKRLKALGYKNVKLAKGDGYNGWKKYAPYDAIMVTAAPDHVPPPLIRQLKEGGRLVIPVGPAGAVQTLWLVRKEAGKVKMVSLGPVRFVPLLRGKR